MTCATIAPILPMAADTPWPVDLYRVGKHSPGIMNVVVFGPQLKKNCAMMYSARRLPWDRYDQEKPMTAKRTVSTMNPMICSGLRPRVSMVRTAVQYPGKLPAQARIIMPTALL